MVSPIEYIEDEAIYDHNGLMIGEEEVTKYHQVGNMPCEPGLQTVQWEDETVVYGKVLFWHVHTSWRPLRKPDVYATPVTHNGAEDGAYILYPDGTIHHYDQVFESLDEWIEDQKELDIFRQKMDTIRAEKKAAAEQEKQTPATE